MLACASLRRSRLPRSALAAVDRLPACLAASIGGVGSGGGGSGGGGAVGSRWGAPQFTSSSSAGYADADQPAQAFFERPHVFSEQAETIVGAQTPVTKRLWQQRYAWTDEQLAAAAPRDFSASQLTKPPKPCAVPYPFSSDPVLREHYRNPSGAVRIGRILEDLDSLAGVVAFDHCDDGNPATRPLLLVTATVEAIQLRSSHLTLGQDMELSGRVVWTGSSSMDIAMELEQAGQQQLTALFTFVARDPVTGKPAAVPALQPQTAADKALFERRLAINQARKAERKQQGQNPTKLHNVSLEGERWAQELLVAAKTKRDLPALADSGQLLMDDTSLENTFTCQPQDRNMHGRVFGGFLMRRAFELAHSTAYLFSGRRPRTVEVDSITFRRPVNVGDLIKFRSVVTRTWSSAAMPGKGLAHIQVEASVTQPEKLCSEVTNTFAFLFSFPLRKDGAGGYLPPKQVLPSTEEQALQVAYLFGPGGKKEAAAVGAAGSNHGT